jgi:hypothetical protein
MRKQGGANMQTMNYRPKAAMQFDFGKEGKEGKINVKEEFVPDMYVPEKYGATSNKSENYTPAHTMPVKTFKSGAIQVSIWENESLGQDNMPKSYKTVSFDRRYKDKAGNWKSTNSLRVNDLPRAVLILQKAYEYLILTESHEEEA